ncbi:MAG: 3-oxoadipate--succinyl-CoA transferase subunit B [Sulfobacillus acidophilus]|uniref:3-oxoadipate--succinyl-CoA transferase subunit B n=1 Tax=Sulfobacillus acidophilus TaxID=53633 RepID=A0A2T2WNR6_9FIRM|nr:MAG: 3-oxoadipate--succinyl-CoA transferase subunit B [Sulfobacillus acidophilus]
MSSDRDQMIVTAARLLNNNERVLVGVGIPNIAANLAKRLGAPDLVLVYESGVIDANPDQLPLSIGDGTLVRNALGVLPMRELFFHYLMAGWIDVGFLGAAQIDVYGNLNSTIIGSYDAPRVRLAGAGGASEIATSARRTIIVMEHARDRFVERVDFVTSVGHEPGAIHSQGPGPWRVVSSLGVFGFDARGRMQLLQLLPGHTYEEVLDLSGWAIPRAPHAIPTVPAPTDRELAQLGHLYATLPKGVVS